MLDARNQVYLADAAFLGKAVAVAWAEYGDVPRVRVRTSTDRGQTFSPTAVFRNTNQAAVAICGDQVNVAYLTRTGHGRWAIDVAFGAVGTDAYAVKRVIGGSGVRRAPDVACTDGRLFVSWYEREGGPWRRWVANALVATHDFGEPVDLGLDRTNYDGYYSPRGFHLAASGRRAYAVFGAADGALRMKRWSIGAAPDYSVTPRAAEVVAPGTRKCPAEFPVIGVDRDTVAVAWERNAGTLVRVSTDRGSSWGPVRDISDTGCGGIVDGGIVLDSIAVAGDRMVIEVSSCGFGFCANTILLTSDAFAHWSSASLWDGKERYQQGHVVGYVTIGGRTRLADAYGNGRRIRYRHQI